MNVALCISGQMRSFRQCFQALDRFILQDLQPDIFIHTWRGSGISHKEESRGDFKEQVVTEQDLRTIYNPVEVVVEDFQPSYTESFGGKCVPTILKEKEPIHYRGALPLFYKIFSCNSLKSIRELETNKKYDLVIRLRPDLLLSQAIDQELISRAVNDNKLYFEADLLDPTFQMSDKFAFASSENMNSYSGLWERLEDYWKKPLGGGAVSQYRVGERLMFHHLRVSGVSSIPFICKCQILRLGSSN